MPGRADPRGADDVEADVALVAERRLAGVQAHAHANLGAARPCVGGERPLALDGRAHRVARARERVEERIALRVDLVPAGALRRSRAAGAGDRPTTCAVVVAELLQQPRRALDVGEQEGDGAARESHAVTVQSVNRLAQRRARTSCSTPTNPVEWFPWGDEALAKARAEDKPILLSVGYAACHWCHVMAHESFEDPEIAALMNERFVNIKVDREERPDVDGIYMDAVVAMTGSGGWPLTVFLTPEGEPFLGGTYFPPAPRHGLPSFPQVLVAVSELYRERRSEVTQRTEVLVDALRAGGVGRRRRRSR